MFCDARWKEKKSAGAWSPMTRCCGIPRFMCINVAHLLQRCYLRVRVYKLINVNCVMHKHYGQTEVPCMVFPHRHNKNIVYLNKLLLFSMKINIIQCDRECDEVKVKVSIHIYIYVCKWSAWNIDEIYVFIILITNYYYVIVFWIICVSVVRNYNAWYFFSKIYVICSGKI